MKLHKKTLGCICAVLISNNVIADEGYKPITKIGSNMLSLLAVGDINIAFERQIMKKLSTTFSAHYFKTKELTGNEGSANRISTGLRAYKDSQKLSGNFIEAKAAVIEFNEATENAGPLSFEFYFGTSKNYNEFIFYEAKIGVLRLIDPGKIVPSGGFIIGGRF